MKMAAIDNSGRTMRELLADLDRYLDTPRRLRLRLAPALCDRIIADMIADPVPWGRVGIFTASAARKAGRHDE